jgi:NitT/TauT family transport system substrate-binding protein
MDASSWNNLRAFAGGAPGMGPCSAGIAPTEPAPAATSLRASLKASELCAADANSAIESFMACGHSPVPELNRQAMRRLPHGKWRDCDADETVRFFALRMCEAGMVNSAL